MHYFYDDELLLNLPDHILKTWKLKMLKEIVPPAILKINIIDMDKFTPKTLIGLEYAKHRNTGNYKLPLVAIEPDDPFFIHPVDSNDLLSITLE